MSDALAVVKPYRLVAKLKNNRLWEAIVTTWPEVTKQSEAARVLKMRPTELGRLLNMDWWPGCRHQRRGEPCQPKGSGRRNQCREGWSKTAWKVVKCMGYAYPPEWLFEGRLYGVRPSPVSMPISETTLRAAVTGGMLNMPESPEANVDRAELKTGLLKILETLTQREAMVLRRRFGLDDGDEHTLDEVGQELNLGKERIRQVEKKALNRLRHWTRAKKLQALA